MQINIKIEGKIVDKLKKAPAMVKEKIQAGVRDSSTLLMEQSIRNAPASTGTLRKSIRREIATTGFRAAIFPTVGYAFFLHGDGQKQRSGPFTIPSNEAQEGGTLYRWAKKKGLNPWAVRASIAKKGIKLNPWLFETSKENEGKVKDIFAGVLNNIAATLAD